MHTRMFGGNIIGRTCPAYEITVIISSRVARLSATRTRALHVRPSSAAVAASGSKLPAQDHSIMSL